MHLEYYYLIEESRENCKKIKLGWIEFFKLKKISTTMFHLKKIKLDFIQYMIDETLLTIWSIKQIITIKKKTHVRATFMGFVIKQNTK